MAYACQSAVGQCLWPLCEPYDIADILCKVLLEEKQGVLGVLGSDALFNICLGDAGRALLTRGFIFRVTVWGFSELFSSK